MQSAAFLLTLWISLSSLLFSGVIASTKPKVRGLSPEEHSTLTFDDQSFTCRDHSKQIPFSQVNDNYCDCPDGSDEPGTSACPNGRFWCRNSGHEGHYIFSAQVGDSICDCCDGSDERDEGKVTCKNTCFMLAEEKRKERLKEIENHREGLKKKEEFIRESNKEIEEKKERLKELKDSVSALEEEKQKYEEEKKRLEEEKKEKEKELEELRAQEAEENRKKRKKERVGEKEGEEAEEEEEEEEEESEEVDKGEKKSKEVADDDDDDEEKKDKGVKSEEDDEEEEEEEDFDDDDDVEGDPVLKSISTELKKAKEDFDAASKKLKETKDEIKQLEDKLIIDYGKDNAFYYLHGSCFSTQTVEYTYELCPFDKVTQKPKAGSSTNLGKWDNSKQPAEWSENHSKMLYSGGAKCWGGPDRSCAVDIFCDKETRVSDPAEPNKCEYSLKFYTPAACSKEHLQALELEEHAREHMHDEL